MECTNITLPTIVKNEMKIKTQQSVVVVEINAGSSRILATCKTVIEVPLCNFLPSGLGRQSVKNRKRNCM